MVVGMVSNPDGSQLVFIISLLYIYIYLGKINLTDTIFR